MFKVFVKDCNKLNEKVKSEMIGLSYDVGEDLLTTQNGKITVSELDTSISEGDIVFVVSKKGKILYVGKIKSIKDTTINTSQINEIFNDTWLYDIVDDTDLETTIYNSLLEYCKGKIKGSSYEDTLRKAQLNTLKLRVKTHTEGEFGVEEEEHKQMSMLDFIYSLFEKFNIVVRPNIPFTEWASGSDTATIDIYKPNYEEMVISDNVAAIQNLEVKTSVEKVNRLIIFSKGTDEEPSVYRATYVYTAGGIVKEPATYDNRLKSINTKIVFSDDEEDVLIENNLPDKLFDHQITFSLVVDNKIYKWDDFKLGMPIKLYKEGHYYNSILTAYKIAQKDGEEDLITAEITLGKVRTALTKRLKMTYGIGGK